MRRKLTKKKFKALVRLIKDEWNSKPPDPEPKCPRCNGKGIEVCEDGDTVNNCRTCYGTGIENDQTKPDLPSPKSLEDVIASEWDEGETANRQLATAIRSYLLERLPAEKERGQYLYMGWNQYRAKVLAMLEGK